MLKNWKPYILNAFDSSYSNAFTEGCSNAIKALKRVVFGFRNFSNFRARILQAANPRLLQLFLTGHGDGGAFAARLAALCRLGL